MKIRKFVAKTMPEAMKEIKEKLGNDAIILNSKEIKAKGILGLLGKKEIEVTAMLDRDLQGRVSKQVSKQSVNHKSRPTISIDRGRKKDQEDQLLEEIKHIQSILMTKSLNKDSSFPPMLQHVYEFFLEQEVEPHLAETLVKSMEEKAKEEDLDRQSLVALLGEVLEEQLANLAYQGIDRESTVIQLVGPTGVGKTTTIAKVAARYILDEQAKIAFITADTYRIAAIEQLKTYARILDVPLEVVYSTKDYEKALEKFAAYDYIFVDTAGRNYRENRYIKELNEFLQIPRMKSQTFLVLSLTAKSKDLQDIYHQFKKLGIDRVIVTKIDETDSYGSLLNLGLSEAVDFSYFANGQNVPDDLIEASPRFIRDLIIRRYKNV